MARVKIVSLDTTWLPVLSSEVICANWACIRLPAIKGCELIGDNQKFPIGDELNTRHGSVAIRKTEPITMDAANCTNSVFRLGIVACTGEWDS